MQKPGFDSAALSDPAKFDPKADFQGNPHQFMVLIRELQMKVVDAWANRTHFSAPAKFDMSALPKILQEVRQIAGRTGTKTLPGDKWWA